MQLNLFVFMRKVNGRRGEADLTKQHNYIKSLHVKINDFLKIAQHVRLRKMIVNEGITSLFDRDVGHKALRSTRGDATEKL